MPGNRGRIQAASDADEVRWVERAEWNSHSALVLDPVTVRVIENGWQLAHSQLEKGDRKQVKQTRKALWFAGALLALLLAAVSFWARPVSFYDGFSEMRLYFSGTESLSATVSGYRVHYYALGPKTGPVVVLVHGLGGRANDWEKVAPYLVKAGYRVYLPDLPGYGRQ